MNSTNYKINLDNNYHIPVLLKSVLELLINPSIKNHIIIDCTVGGGGHSLEIGKKIMPEGKLICIDRDENAIMYSKERLRKNGVKAEFFKGNFSDIEELLSSINIKFATGILIDLGLSSFQLENEDGFSFTRNTVLDMRSDKSQTLKASDVLNRFNKNELNKIFKEFGEIKNYKKVSEAIIEYRKKKKIQTTFEFIEILKSVYKRRLTESTLAKIFQAIRIYVNNELENLRKVLEDSFKILADGGRLVVLSYHSLEDRIVKYFFRKYSITSKNQNNNIQNRFFEIITKKPIVPDYDEIRNNRRARSAKLRAAELKIAYAER